MPCTRVMESMRALADGRVLLQHGAKLAPDCLATAVSQVMLIAQSAAWLPLYAGGGFWKPVGAVELNQVEHWCNEGKD